MRGHLNVLLMFLGLLSASTFAQKDIYELQNINVKDGLPNSNVHDILQDRDNFIWISTLGGLTRYNGYTFTYYDASFFDINEGATLSLALDAENRIWFCEDIAYSTDLSSGVFDTQKDTIYNFETISNGLFTSGDVFSLNPSKYLENVIFIATKDGAVYQYDGKFKKLYTVPSFRNRRVHCEVATDGSYWITYDNTAITNINEQGKVLNTFKVKLDDFVISNIISTEPNVIIEGYNSALVKDYWQIKDNQLKHFKENKTNNFQLLSSEATEHLFFQNDTLFKQKTDPLDKGIKTPIAHIPNLRYKSVITDKQGILWITSDNGCYKVVTKGNPFTVYEPNNSIRGIYRRGNTLWIGGYNRSVAYDLQSARPKDMDIPKYTFTGFSSDSTGLLWVGTAVNKFLAYNAGTKTWKSYKKKPYDPVHVPYFNPTTKNIWLGGGSGLSFLDENDEIQTYDENAALSEAQIRQFLKTSEGIWIVTNKGLFLMDVKKETIIEHYGIDRELPTNNINHIHKDKDGLFWLATKTEGLIKWDKVRKTFKSYTTQNGLSNNTLYAVYEDDYQNLWLPSNYGLMRFNKESNETQVFTVDDGIADNEFNTFSHFKDDEGSLYFGGIRGVTAFHPKDFVNTLQEDIPLYVSDLKVLKKNASNFETMPLNEEEPTVFLDHSDQIFEFTINLLDYRTRDHHQYAYKIEGFHNQWIYTRDNTISIFNFPYGEHTIKVKGKGDRDLWTNKELAIPIVVNKPLYLKWQFALLSFLMVIAAIYGFFKWRITNLRKAKLTLESVVKSRTEQIEKDKKTIELQTEELRALDIAKGRFFSNLTHEFRTPLTLIIGPLEQMISNPPSPSILKKRATGILQNAKHILGLINQLLDITKIENKQMPLAYVNRDIIAYTKDLVQRFRTTATSKGQELAFTTNESEWFIYFDADAWDKMVYNLVSNALKFTPKQGRIAVCVNRYKGDKELKLALEVSDSGIGIDEKNISAIFDRFYQVDASSVRTNEGSGIGLALVKELVELQKGSISVTSQLNTGTSFRILLPIPYEIENTTEVGSSQTEFLIPTLQNDEEELMPFTKTGNLLDILVVEDNPQLLDYIAQCLDPELYNIYTAKNGSEGVEKALLTVPDLIISDIMMPKKDGIGLVQDLRGHLSTSHIPIVLLTAKTEIESKLQALNYGADAYLTKPFNPLELVAVVQNLIDTRQRLQKRYAQNKTSSLDAAFTKEDAFLFDLKEYIVMNLSKTDLNGDTIGYHFGLSRIHLYRKLKALTNVSISEFVKNIRLEKGRDLIAQNQLNISEISYEIGFTSPSHFSRSFKEKYGYSPSKM